MRFLFALICVLALAGCGHKEDFTTEGETEGIWVDVGELDYHVQGSRILNPYQVPDDRYLAGVPADEPAPTAEEAWFAIFLRIENKTDAAAPVAEEFEIEDTEGTLYEPVELDTEMNPYALAPQELGSKDNVPHPDSSQEYNSTQGSMLLFKLPIEGYQKRPLEFIIHRPEGSSGPEEAMVALDL